MKACTLKFFSVIFSFSLAAALMIPLNAEHSEGLNPKRVKFLSEIKELNLGEYLPIPEVTLHVISIKKEDIPVELRTGKEFENFDKIFELQDKDEFEKAYVEADRFVTKHNLAPLSEWAQILKADLLFQVQEKNKNKRFNLPLEEYQDVLRRYPLNPQNPRILYQMGLLQLKMSLFSEVNGTVSRALKEFESSEYAPLFRLLDAEQAFFSKDDLKAAFIYTTIIQKYPKHRAAVDSAFRKAFILFRKSDFSGALKIYEDLEKFHSEELDLLKMKAEPSASEKFIDRVYYAETIYLNQKYSEAAKLFQDLANIFPSHFSAPFLLLRLGDTYFWRKQFRAAEELYRFVLEKKSENRSSVAAAKMRLADLYFLTDAVDGSEQSGELYRQAYEMAEKDMNEGSDKSKGRDLAALALTKLAAYHIYFKTYPKAEATLRSYREKFTDTPNQAWVDAEFTKMVELEIIDHYRREDYLAALSTYLMFEKDQSNHFQNTHALLRIADAASKLSLHEKASQILNRVIYLEKTPEGRQEALLKLVEILIRQGEIRKASERLRRFNFAYPNTSFRYLYEWQWGQLYTALKNHEQALNHYEKALEATAGSPAKTFEVRYAYLRLAEEYEKQSLPLKAVEAFEKYAKIVKEVADNPLSGNQVTKKDLFLLKFTRYRIADTLFNMHDYVRALEAYRVVTKEIREEPFLSHAHYRIAECYLALNDRKAALKAFEEIQSTDPKNIWARAAKSYIASVQMEVKYGIRVFN